MLMFLDDSLRMFNFTGSPIRVVFYKPGEPETAGQSHEEGLQGNHDHGVNSQPPEKTRIIQRKSYDNPPGNEGRYTESHCKRITHITRSIIKTRFNFSGLSAHRTIFMHLHRVFQVVGIGVLENFSSPAPWTTVVYRTQ